MTGGRARFLLVAVGLCALGMMACSRGKADGKLPAALPGTTLDGREAPDFRLRDQEGNEVSLSGMRGRPVLLTFLFTTCPDVCPLITEKLRQTVEQAGQDGTGGVALVAVSVDPEQDSEQAARNFTAAHRMGELNWHFLVGSEEELSPVWGAYGIGRISPYPEGAVDAKGRVGHTDAVYLIDSAGRLRSLVRGDFNPAELAPALRTLQL